VHDARDGRVDSVLFLPDGFDYKSYTTIRLYDLTSKAKEMLTQLVDLEAGHDEVISILKLEDESFELGVLKTYIPELKVFLNTKLLKYSVDWKHRPFNPRLKDVENFCATHPELSNDHAKAEAQMVDLFLKRANKVVEGGWAMQVIWYTYLLKRAGF
jgi:hypothetical protein